MVTDYNGVNLVVGCKVVVPYKRRLVVGTVLDFRQAAVTREQSDLCFIDNVLPDGWVKVVVEGNHKHFSPKNVMVKTTVEE